MKPSAVASAASVPSLLLAGRPASNTNNNTRGAAGVHGHVATPGTDAADGAADVRALTVTAALREVGQQHAGRSARLHLLVDAERLAALTASRLRNARAESGKGKRDT